MPNLSFLHSVAKHLVPEGVFSRGGGKQANPTLGAKTTGSDRNRRATSQNRVPIKKFDQKKVIDVIWIFSPFKVTIAYIHTDYSSLKLKNMFQLYI